MIYSADKEGEQAAAGEWQVANGSLSPSRHILEPGEWYWGPRVADNPLTLLPHDQPPHTPKFPEKEAGGGDDNELSLMLQEPGSTHNMNGWLEAVSGEPLQLIFQS